jgi:putative flavoprotein involved in K+ transport
MRKVDVLVIGAGQAGLATSYHLSRRGIEHAVVDRDGPGESWRLRRWDSFVLNAPNWSFELPGFPYDGPAPDAFMPRDEIAQRFATYARQIQAPVESGVDVTRLGRNQDGRYRLTTSAGEIEARAVVVATGAYQRRHRPPESFDASVMQLHTDQFRNAAQLREGGVLIVGAGQSGCQVAEDLSEAGRAVWISAGTCGWIPRRYRGRDNVRWRMDLGMFDDTVEKLGHELRLACPPMQTGVGFDRDINLRTLAEQGVTLAGRFKGADGTAAYFADDLPESGLRSDESALGLLKRIDQFITTNGIDAPPAQPFRPVGRLPPGPTELELKRESITNVIWASGFRLDFSWIDLDLNPRDGYPEQVQGVSRYPGLYFMGLQLMHTRKSGLIFGVGEDAAHVASVVADQLGAPAQT